MTKTDRTTMGKAKRAAVERAVARTKHREKVANDFSERHPDRAAQERKFRREARERRKAHANRDRHRDAGTPETAQKAKRVQQGALARLFELGHLSADELAWSQEIRQVTERIARDVAIGSVSLETRVDQSRNGTGAFYESLGAVRAELAYTNWRKAIAEPNIVLAMIVGDEGYATAARRFEVHHSKAKKLLLDALDAWPDHCRDARDAIDEADLLAAQAGLLS